MNAQFSKIVSALEALPSDTILDGEIVALDDHGRPSFNLLQNHRSAASTIVFYAFDLLAYAGKSVVRLPLSRRRHLLERALERVTEPIRLSHPAVTVHRIAAERVPSMRQFHEISVQQR